MLILKYFSILCMSYTYKPASCITLSIKKNRVIKLDSFKAYGQTAGSDQNIEILWRWYSMAPKREVHFNNKTAQKKWLYFDIRVVSGTK
jgi:hypothetical protein